MSKKIFLTIISVHLCLLLFSQKDFEGVIRYKLIIQFERNTYSPSETDTGYVVAYFNPGKILIRGIAKNPDENVDLLIMQDSLKYYIVHHDKKGIEEKTFSYKPIPPASTTLVIKGQKAVPFFNSNNDEEGDATYWLAETMQYKFPGLVDGDDDIALLNILIRNNRIVLKALSYEGKRSEEDPGLLKTAVKDNEACTRMILEAIDIKIQKNNHAIFSASYLQNNPAK